MFELPSFDGQRLFILVLQVSLDKVYFGKKFVLKNIDQSLQCDTQVSSSVNYGVVMLVLFKM